MRLLLDALQLYVVKDDQAFPTLLVLGAVILLVVLLPILNRSIK